MYAKKKCMKCGKAATHKFTRIENGQVNDIFLCAEHAAEMSPYQKPKFPLGEILEGLLKQDYELKASGPQPPTGLRCPNCGLSYDSYRRNLILGCSDCYDSFREYLVGDLRKFHGDIHHKGRCPEGMNKKPGQMDELSKAMEKESAGPIPECPETSPTMGAKVIIKDPHQAILELQQAMQRAIDEEDFAMAAHYRDQIKELRESMDEGDK